MSSLDYLTGIMAQIACSRDDPRGFGRFPVEREIRCSPVGVELFYALAVRLLQKNPKTAVEQQLELSAPIMHGLMFIGKNSGVNAMNPRKAHWTSVGVCLSALLAAPTMLRATPITVDGAGDRFGQFPTVAYGLAEQEAGADDILPTGPSGFFLFGLFDTGSTGVAINADGTNFFFSSDDATNLGIAGTRTVDVRLNGLGATTQADADSVTAPIGAPGTEFAPEIQVSDVAVAPEDVGITLIGAPVANEIAAMIDYTTVVTRTSGSVVVQTPDISFMESDAASAFSSEVLLDLTPFGTVGQNAAGADRGERYYLRDVALNETAGTTTTALGTEYDLFWDTGTNVTLISAGLAGALGLDLTSPDFTGDVGGAFLNGFILDSIVMNGIGGAYTVFNAEVFVDESVVPFGGAADAIIGSNLFSQTSLLFNGPEYTLGIGVGVVAVPEPGSLALLSIGMLFLAMRARGRLRPRR